MSSHSYNTRYQAAVNAEEKRRAEELDALSLDGFADPYSQHILDVSRPMADACAVMRGQRSDPACGRATPSVSGRTTPSFSGRATPVTVVGSPRLPHFWSTYP